MTHRNNARGGRDIAARWCALAEQRLEHLTDMFETGRWRRFHSEVAFLENIQEAKRAVQTWKALATGDVPMLSPSGPFALGWSPQATATRQPAQPTAVQQSAMPAQPNAVPSNIVQPKAVNVAPDLAAPVGLDLDAILDELTDLIEAPPDRLDEPASVLRERATPHPAEFTLSLDGIEAKYPLLRNSF